MRGGRSCYGWGHQLLICRGGSGSAGSGGERLWWLAVSGWWHLRWVRSDACHHLAAGITGIYRALYVATHVNGTVRSFLWNARQVSQADHVNVGSTDFLIVIYLFFDSFFASPRDCSFLPSDSSALWRILLRSAS